ncbi:hypothetical protein [Deinococcus sp. Leaf326]|uniref:hypothetical protein n=1 Tax=Deinococcus sp. Leaf326 TaxID=1736338 RepID=UPI0006F75273|nr:hypothetical protein [Deinococcus sp. Leaf326]KQR01895.1 hypothetical protein ASF71_21535 [Deinococcus sp. Leaf326]
MGKEASLHALNLLWRLLRDKELTDHARYFDQRQGTLGVRPCAPKPRANRQRLDNPPEPATTPVIDRGPEQAPQIAALTPLLGALVQDPTVLSAPERDLLAGLLSTFTPHRLAELQSQIGEATPLISEGSGSPMAFTIN